MTQDEIIEMAREAGLETQGGFSESVFYFSKLIAEREREDCAVICDLFQARNVGMQPAECAGAIRARNNK